MTKTEKRCRLYDSNALCFNPTKVDECPICGPREAERCGKYVSLQLPHCPLALHHLGPHGATEEAR